MSMMVTDARKTDHWQDWAPDPADRLFPLGDGTWAGFVPGLSDGDPYLFWVRGPETGTQGFKRDPYARELGTHPPFPNCPCHRSFRAGSGRL
jgi:1,4-alpha-glucan branching enzyme